MIACPGCSFEVCELDGLSVRMDHELAHYNISLKELADVYGREVGRTRRALEQRGAAPRLPRRATARPCRDVS